MRQDSGWLLLQAWPSVRPTGVTALFGEGLRLGTVRRRRTACLKAEFAHATNTTTSGCPTSHRARNSWPRNELAAGSDKEWAPSGAGTPVEMKRRGQPRAGHAGCPVAPDRVLGRLLPRDEQRCHRSLLLRTRRSARGEARLDPGAASWPRPGPFCRTRRAAGLCGVPRRSRSCVTPVRAVSLGSCGLVDSLASTALISLGVARGPGGGGQAQPAMKMRASAHLHTPCGNEDGPYAEARRLPSHLPASASASAAGSGESVAAGRTVPHR